MINDLNKYVVSSLIGIRFQANFGFSENSGALFDEILYSKNSYFNPKFFPQVNTGVKDRTLYNDSTRNRLRVDTSNIVFELFDNSFDVLQENLDYFKKDLIEDYFVEYGLTRIQRIGLIYRYIIPHKELAKSLIDRTIGKQIENIEDISLKFSKKKFSNSILNKGEGDYQNVIYNINKEVGNDEIYLSIDFQNYYNPLLKETSQINFDKFLEVVNRYNRVNVKDWLNNSFTNEKKIK
jgi:hypothetical protein